MEIMPMKYFTVQKLKMVFFVVRKKYVIKKDEKNIKSRKVPSSISKHDELMEHSLDSHILLLHLIHY